MEKNVNLGSLLDTEDITRRTELPIDTYKTFESILSSKHVSEKVKIEIFATYIKCLHVQLGAMDVDANHGKQHGCVSKEAARKNHKCQMAKGDLQ